MNVNDMDSAFDNAKKLGLDIIANKAKTDLFYLCKYILGGGDLITERTHRQMCDYTKPLLPNFDPKQHELPEGFDVTKNKCLFMMPRGTLKSSIVTIGFTIQNILNDRDIRILIDSETFAKSKAFLSEIKGHLEGNSQLREIYHHIYGSYPDDNKRNDLWTDSQVNMSSRTRRRKEASVSCSGIDVTKNGMHYDLIIGDDLHSEKNITSKEQIEQVIDHYKLAFSLLDPKKPMIIIGTRWDYNDLFQHIIDNEAHRFNIMIKQAIQEDGSLLFPERLDQNFLDEMRQSQGSYIFSCQYQNNPIDSATATFKRSSFKKISWELVKDKPMNWFLAIDPSYDGEYSDYAAFALVGMDFEQQLYIRNIHRAKMTYSDIVNLMFDWNQKYQPRRIALETVGSQKSIEYTLNSEQKRRGIWLPVEKIASRHKSKEERIRALAPFYEFGRMFHVAESSQLEELEDELMHFPKGKHDDIIDAVATILEIATPPGRKSHKRKQRRKKSGTDTSLKPRSPISGY